MLHPPVILPPRLDDLLVRIADARAFPVPSYGFTSDCANADHDMRTWVEGQYAGRDIRLRKCSGCASVEVRDVSFDLAIGATRLARRRIDALLGWYSGPRSRRREYLG